jgi:hypothetical protein
MSAELDLENVSHPITPSEEQNHHFDRPSENGGDLLEAKHAIAGHRDTFYFGPERKAERIAERAREVRQLAQTVVTKTPPLPPSFKGGEHAIWVIGDPATRVFKKTFDSSYGYVLDEQEMLDDRTLLNRRQLFMRPALPSEYLLRWAVLHAIFQLPTRYEGHVPNRTGDPDMAISQPYIEQDENDPPQPEDITKFMIEYDFVKVESGKVVTPEQKDVTWYRKKDGILISDAYARNFRKSPHAHMIVPVDLVVTIVPPGVSKLLPAPDSPWSFAASNQDQAANL